MILLWVLLIVLSSYGVGTFDDELKNTKIGQRTATYGTVKTLQTFTFTRSHLDAGRDNKRIFVANFFAI